MRGVQKPFLRYSVRDGQRKEGSIGYIPIIVTAEAFSFSIMVSIIPTSNLLRVRACHSVIHKQSTDGLKRFIFCVCMGWRVSQVLQLMYDRYTEPSHPLKTPLEITLEKLIPITPEMIINSIQFLMCVRILSPYEEHSREEMILSWLSSIPSQTLFGTYSLRWTQDLQVGTPCSMQYLPTFADIGTRVHRKISTGWRLNLRTPVASSSLLPLSKMPCFLNYIYELSYLILVPKLRYFFRCYAPRLA